MRKRELLLILALVIVLASGYATAAKVWRFDAIQIPSGTTSANAVNWGADVAAYRDATARLKIASSAYVQDDVLLGAANTNTTYIAGPATAAATLGVNGNTVLGDAATDTITCTGRLILRTLGSDPLDGTPGNRPAGTVNEIAVYSAVIYMCTNASTPTWVRVTDTPAG